ncbi:hypothetical protein BK131_04535 [Paenibacillus amylolyticus]|uniref:Thoeris anti-defense 2-like domain-containing protein n=1 Tax=Paenibacillus amylolyticus TaxID=1451 RepID=A0A1R1C5B7_PAEAM|nr:DUF2829 domain-containing protein [Paenibacillus amylolyticus]OMF17237.1 hypothetical protein BK131_04535 [Paenibacillus amylolyticus]
MDFGKAIEALKDGKRVARAGWNGKGMFIYLVDGSTVEAMDLRNEAATHVGDNLPPFTNVRINPHIDMKSADGSIVVGWLASQTDVLADDWVIAN